MSVSRAWVLRKHIAATTAVYQQRRLAAAQNDTKATPSIADKLMGREILGPF